MRSGTPRQAAEAGVRAAVRALATGRMVVVADDLDLIGRVSTPAAVTAHNIA